jgi:hypothetical protein
MTDPERRLEERELNRRRENEIKDLATEADHSERPLEGLSGAHTTWTGEQDDSQAGVHQADERRSEEASRAQIPEKPPEHPE